MDFKLRPWTMDDLDNLVKYANNFKIAQNLTNKFPYPYTTEAGTKFIKMVTKEGAKGVFAIEVNGEAAGGIGLHPQDDIMCKNAELGYWLAEPYWGKGIITRAIRQITDWGFANLDVERIFARPYGANIGSQKALEKAGYIFETSFEKTIFKNGEFHDELFYAVRRKNWNA